MPEPARRDWEHLFEPWFNTDTPAAAASSSSTPAAAENPAFAAATQPLAVNRKAYARHQPPPSADVESRTARITAEVERLIAFVERRHVGVEGLAGAPAPVNAEHSSPPRPRDIVAQRQPESGIETDQTGEQPSALENAGPSGARWFRGFLLFAAIALITASIVFVQRSATAALIKAEAAERLAIESRLSAAQSIASSSERAQQAIARALVRAARAERMIDVMAAPDARIIELRGRTGAPAAVGQAVYSRSRGVLVSATDMPRPAEGQVFQVWAITSDGPVNLGLANPDAQGRLAVAYELTPGLTGPIKGLVITQERIGVASSPAGPVILSQ